MENKSKEQGLLEIEATIMSYLKGPNIPSVRSFGTSGNYNILIMQSLGKSLEQIFEEILFQNDQNLCKNWKIFAKLKLIRKFAKQFEYKFLTIIIIIYNIF